MENLNNVEMEIVCGGGMVFPVFQWVIGPDGQARCVGVPPAPGKGFDVPGPVHSI
ncbi:hypothetical protein ACLB1G_27245 [Oxalobacteraceae bacterium A2-2]